MKRVIFGIFISVIVTFCIINYTQKECSTKLDILSLSNIEALAAGEGMGDIACYGKGTVDCPNGVKVEYYFNNLSLD